MAITTYYIIRAGKDRYIQGTSKRWRDSYGLGNARKFKSISEIRSFMTRMLKYPGVLEVDKWIIEKYDVTDGYPVTDIFTSSHTMALLKRENMG